MGRIHCCAIGSFLVASVCLCGCSAETYPVQGTVQFEDGRAAGELAGGFVSFQGVERQISAQGEIRGDGTFELSTFAEGDGAFPGAYRVLVTPPPWEGSEGRRVQRLIDPAFSDPEKTPLEVEVMPKRNQVTLPVSLARR
jgi:hypothetical protein